MTLAYTTRPLSDRTWVRPEKDRIPTRFTSSWPDTLELLESEVALLDGRNVVIEVDVAESDLRLDGRLRSRARADSPAVIVSFDSRHGPLMYRSDRFTTSYSSQGEPWHHNVRAVALTLQALRAVDRYGASASGEQYTGYRQIAASPADAPPSVTMAWEILAALAGVPVPSSAGEQARCVRLAQRAAHPDSGGSREAWEQFTRASQAVGR